jgi:hypothetical protein
MPSDWEEQQMTDPAAEVTARPLFTLMSPAWSGEWSPRTVEEVREWLGAEAKAWEWLRVIRNPDNITNAFAAIQFHQEQELNTFISFMTNEPSRRDELAPQIQARLDRRYNVENALYSKTPKGAVRTLAERQGRESGGAHGLCPARP